MKSSSPMFEEVRAEWSSNGWRGVAKKAVRIAVEGWRAVKSLRRWSSTSSALSGLLLLLSLYMVWTGSQLHRDNFGENGRTMRNQKLHFMTRRSHKMRALQPVKVSLVVLTYKKRKLFQRLLESIAVQETNFRFEVIVGDSGCVNGLYGDIVTILGGEDRSSSGSRSSAETASQAFITGIDFKYLPMCENPGYSVGNNRAAQLVDSDSEFILFLNDDIVMGNSFYIQSMLDLLELHADTAVAVGCVIMNEKGTHLLEAGSIVWSDGSTMGFARDRTDFSQPHLSEDLHFARPVDFISAACLMVDINIFQSVGGFDQTYPAYYEDTDLQMKFRHPHNKEVWVQPLAVSLHSEHGSFGSTHSKKLMQNSRTIFSEKWGSQLEVSNLFPGPLSDRPDFQALRASDIRGCETTQYSPNVLYLDDTMPFDNQRTFDNLVLLQQMGLRVTFFATKPQFNMSDSLSSRIDARKTCQNGRDISSILCTKHSLQQLGIEVMQQSESNTLERLLTNRYQYYNVIVVTNSETFYDMLSRNSSLASLPSLPSLPSVSSPNSTDFERAIHECIIIYDTGRTGFRSPDKLQKNHPRDDGYLYSDKISSRQLSQGNGLVLPQSDYTDHDNSKDPFVANFQLDMTLIAHHADAVITESEHIREQFRKYVEVEKGTTFINVTERRTRQLEDDDYIITIGHSNLVTREAEYPTFEDRKNSILFVGYFNDQHAANRGTLDAIWTFLIETYPLVLQQAPGTTLTIVGYGIPQDLYDEVSNNLLFNNLVTLVDSLNDVTQPTQYLDDSRIFIAPHLYSHGIKYEVSQALAAGVPTIMSGAVEEEYEKSIADHGVCVGATPSLFAQCIVTIGFDANLWYEHHTQAIKFAKLTQMSTRNKILWRKVLDDGFRRKRERGELVSELFSLPSDGLKSKQCKDIIQSYLNRYTEAINRQIEEEDEDISAHDHFFRADPRDGFIFNLEDEKTYLSIHKDVKHLVLQKVYITGWHHFQTQGQSQGYIYSPEAESQYIKRYPDVRGAVESGDLKSGWIHYINYGKQEGRVYGCW